MGSRPKRSEASLLEHYRVSLTNAQEHTDIATALTDFGYDTAKLTEGQSLLNETRAKFDSNKVEKEEKLASYKEFAEKENSLDKTYTLHRKKAKIVFSSDSNALSKLVVDKNLPDSYIDWLEMVKVFYSALLADETLQQKIARLKVTVEDLNATSNMIVDLEEARANYLKERGESQVAKEEKDDSFDQLNNWMKEFYAVAKIAFEDTPQQLEILGVYVKS